MENIIFKGLLVLGFLIVILAGSGWSTYRLSGGNKMTEYPKIKHLPTAEQKPFREWLKGKEQPLGPGHEDMARDQWDWYYPNDYITWKMKQ